MVMNHLVNAISLARWLDQHQTFAGLNAPIDVEFFDAIEGAQVMPEVNNLPDLFEPGLRYMPARSAARSRTWSLRRSCTLVQGWRHALHKASLSGQVSRTISRDPSSCSWTVIWPSQNGETTWH